MDIDLVIQESEEILLKEGAGDFTQGLKQLSRLTWTNAKEEMLSAFQELSKFIVDNNLEQKVIDIISKGTGHRFSNLKQVLSVKISESSIDEGVMKNWWDEARGNFYGAISFYPLLQAFIELDRVIKGAGGANMKYVVIYGLMWAAIVAGKSMMKGKDGDMEVGKTLGKSASVAANTNR